MEQESLNGIHRHDILRLTQAGETETWMSRQDKRMQDELCREKYPNVPAICTGGQDRLHEGKLRVGISYPLRINGGRWRISAYASVDTIAQVITPWELVRHGASLPGRFEEAIQELSVAADRNRISIGLFGATALQRATAYPYLHDGSDMDIAVCTEEKDGLLSFADALRSVEQRYALPIDAEVQLTENRGVKLKELIETKSAALVKGNGTPHLLSHHMVWEAIKTVDK